LQWGLSAKRPSGRRSLPRRRPRLILGLEAIGESPMVIAGQRIAGQPNERVREEHNHNNRRVPVCFSAEASLLANTPPGSWRGEGNRTQALPKQGGSARQSSEGTDLYVVSPGGPNRAWIFTVKGLAITEGRVGNLFRIAGEHLARNPARLTAWKKAICARRDRRGKRASFTPSPVAKLRSGFSRLGPASGRMTRSHGGRG